MDDSVKASVKDEKISTGDESKAAPVSASSPPLAAPVNPPNGILFIQPISAKRPIPIDRGVSQFILIRNKVKEAKDTKKNIAFYLNVLLLLMMILATLIAYVTSYIFVGYSYWLDTGLRAQIGYLVLMIITHVVAPEISRSMQSFLSSYGPSYEKLILLPWLITFGHKLYKRRRLGF